MLSPSKHGGKILAGIDGCKGGWVCALRYADSAAVEIRLLTHIEQIAALKPRPAIAAIDMPIGFLDQAVEGGRECERQARKKLPGRTSCVFSAPCRAVLPMYPDGHKKASQRNRESGPDGVGLSIQAFHLLPKLKELDDFLDIAHRDWIIESHPELAFALLNSERPVLEPKRKMPGRNARIKLLRDVPIEVPNSKPASHNEIEAEWDDILDAIVLTLTSERVLKHKATVLGKGSRDSRGLRMEICF